MILTNKHNLPIGIVEAVTAYNSAYDKVGDISVTSTIKSPRQRLLTERYFDVIEKDVSEFLWVMLGSAMHDIVSKFNSERYLIEERMVVNIEGYEVSLKPDVYDKEAFEVTDYKITSGWSLHYDKPEWEQQLNMYAFGLRAYGYKVDTLSIQAIIRDHGRLNVAKFPDVFPLIPFKRVEVPLWSNTEQHRWLNAAVLYHMKYNDVEDDKLPLCTSSEMWEKPTKWAIYKIGQDVLKARATRVFDDYVEAHNYQHKSSDYFIYKRAGERQKCLHYCDASEYCNQNKKLLKEENGQKQV